MGGQGGTGGRVPFRNPRGNPSSGWWQDGSAEDDLYPSHASPPLSAPIDPIPARRSLLHPAEYAPSRSWNEEEVSPVAAAEGLSHSALVMRLTLITLPPIFPPPSPPLAVSSSTPPPLALPQHLVMRSPPLPPPNSGPGRGPASGGSGGSDPAGARFKPPLPSPPPSSHPQPRS